MISSMTTSARRIGVGDIAFAVVLSGLGILLMLVNVDDADIDANVLAVPFFLAITVPVLWRRVALLPAMGVSFVALLVHIALFGSLVRCGAIYPLAFVYAFTGGSSLEGRDSWMALALAFAMTIAMAAADYLGAGILVISPTIALLWGAGRFARSRSHMVDELDRRTAELRAARDERARLEIATDRARLSAELDELLRARLGTLAELAETRDPSRLVEIEHESRRTLEDMREIVGVLRSDDGSVAVAPPPTLAHLEALVLRTHGEKARIKVAGDPRVLPAGVELSAYRVVEHLLEAMGDTPDVDVEVTFADDALGLTVRGPARRRSQSGAAVERARERVQLHRGTLKTSVRGGRAEAYARLPVGLGV